MKANNLEVAKFMVQPFIPVETFQSGKYYTDRHGVTLICLHFNDYGLILCLPDGTHYLACEILDPSHWRIATDSEVLRAFDAPF